MSKKSRFPKMISGRCVEHKCEDCGGSASFGFGVSLLHGKIGKWYCFKHRPKGGRDDEEGRNADQG